MRQQASVVGTPMTLRHSLSHCTGVILAADTTLQTRGTSTICGNTYLRCAQTVDHFVDLVNLRFSRCCDGLDLREMTDLLDPPKGFVDNRRRPGLRALSVRDQQPFRFPVDDFFTYSTRLSAANKTSTPFALYCRFRRPDCPVASTCPSSPSSSLQDAAE